MAHKFQNDEKIRSDVKKYEFWNSKATKLDAKFERIFTFYSSKTIVLQFFSHQTLISLFWKSLKQVWVFFCFRLFFNFFFVGGYEHMWTKLRLFISFLQYSSRDYFTRKFFERLNSFFMFFFEKIRTHLIAESKAWNKNSFTFLFLRLLMHKFVSIILVCFLQN